SRRRLHGATHLRLATLDGAMNCRHDPLPSLLLAFLAEDVFARVPDTLALVGLGRPVATDLGSDLADHLAVDTGHDDLGRPRRGNRNALGDRVVDLMAVAELQMQVLALHGGAIAHPGDLQPFL